MKALGRKVMGSFGEVLKHLSTEQPFPAWVSCTVTSCMWIRRTSGWGLGALLSPLHALVFQLILFPPHSLSLSYTSPLNDFQLLVNILYLPFSQSSLKEISLFYILSLSPTHTSTSTYSQVPCLGQYANYTPYLSFSCARFGKTFSWLPTSIWGFQNIYPQAIRQNM